MVLWLLKMLGLKEATKWAVRLVLLALFLLGLLVVLVLLIFSEEVRKATLVILAVGAVAFAIRAILVSQKGVAEAEPRERTIDGKVVPEKLVVAALDVPPQSPDGEYVLRGLPDYGKALLKLNNADFVYVPEPLRLPEIVPERPVEEPAANDGWFANVPRGVLGAVITAVVLLAMLGLVMYKNKKRDADAAYNAWMSTPLVVEPDSAPAAPTATTAPRTLTADSSQNGTQQSPTDYHPPEESASEKGLPDSANSMIFRDPSTGLRWMRVNSSEIVRDYGSARQFCNERHMRIDGWRLPSYPEINALMTETPEGPPPGMNLDNPITLWSSTPAQGVHEVLMLNIPSDQDFHDFLHVVCVHD